MSDSEVTSPYQWSEEAASIEAAVNVAVSEYERAAYIEGMKLE